MGVASRNKKKDDVKILVSQFDYESIEYIAA